MANNNDEIYWQKTSKLMWIMMILWAFFSFIVHMFVVPLNNIKIWASRSASTWLPRARSPSS